MDDFDRKLSEINLKYDGATIQIQNHVVSFSGGVGSWATAKRVKEKYGIEKMTLLFADTMMEDPVVGITSYGNYKGGSFR